jgi:glycosyltransferase involved in cell wall biosynthesis
MPPGVTRADEPAPSCPADGVASVLAVTSELPWPLDTGGHLRTFHLLRALAGRFRVRLVAAAPAGQDEAIAALQAQGIVVRPAIVAPRARWREALRAGAAAVRGEPYVFYRRHDRRAVRAALRAEVAGEPPDGLYLDHLDSLVFRPILGSAPWVIDLHNVYSCLARRAADQQRGRWARRYLRREATLLERMERRAAHAAAALLVVSEEDRRHFAALGAGDRRVVVVPNGVDCAAYEALPLGRPQGTPVLLYVGAMSWDPNVRAAQFLAGTVLPLVRARYPDARLRLVGRDPTAEVRALGRWPGVEVTGTVPDVVPYLRAAHVLAVPLEAGGGTRLKILEAFAAGLPVVSTPVGCEGLRVAHGEHLVIAGRDHFAAELLALLNDPARATRLAERARALAHDLYDWCTVGEAVCAAVAAVIRPRDFPDDGFEIRAS